MPFKNGLNSQFVKVRKQAHRGDNYSDWDESEYIGNLQEMLETGIKFLDVWDAEVALILRVLLEELTEDYNGDMDYNGDLAFVIQDIGMPLAEAILRVELDSHNELVQVMQEEVYDNLDETIEESELEDILVALGRGRVNCPMKGRNGKRTKKNTG